MRLVSRIGQIWHACTWRNETSTEFCAKCGSREMRLVRFVRLVSRVAQIRHAHTWVGGGASAWIGGEDPHERSSSARERTWATYQKDLPKGPTNRTYLKDLPKGPT